MSEPITQLNQMISRYATEDGFTFSFIKGVGVFRFVRRKRGVLLEWG